MSEIKQGSVIQNVNDAYGFAANCAPYEIHRAILSDPLSGEKEVYLLGLRGTDSDFDVNSPLSIPTCFKSFAARQNPYTRLVKKAMLDEIPAGANVVFIGHSLGGMVSQQLGADEELKNRYHILHILTMGSPWVIQRNKPAPFHRMADHSDIIPHLFCSGLLLSYFFGNVTHEYAGYFGHPVKSHCDSYEKSPVWQRYDCFGVKNGGHSLTVTE